MSKVVAGITVWVDGFITGPDDGPGCALGAGWRAAALPGLRRTVLLRLAGAG
jgi:hypothetical protein